MFQVEWKGVERQTTDEVEHFHALDKQFTVVIETKNPEKKPKQRPNLEQISY